MRRRLFNIASAIFLVLCVALIGLWVRSYSWEDQCFFRPFGSHPVFLASEAGRLVLGIVTMGSPTHQNQFEASHAPLKNWRGARAQIDRSTFGFGGFGIIAPVNPSLVVPHWFAIVLAGALALVPWSRARCRFGLRSMLIAVTLLAIVLGIVAWLDRAWIGK
jgi:hypothetical protein